jgi:hypothetical protein
MLICVEARIFFGRASSFRDIQRIGGAESSHPDGPFERSEGSGMVSTELAIGTGKRWAALFTYNFTRKNGSGWKRRYNNCSKRRYSQIALVMERSPS